mgnify:CR=1 FL=1
MYDIKYLNKEKTTYISAQRKKTEFMLYLSLNSNHTGMKSG